MNLHVGNFWMTRIVAVGGGGVSILFRNVIIVGVKISFQGQSQRYFLAKKEKE